jgi:hypothetical protein
MHMPPFAMTAAPQQPVLDPTGLIEPMFVGQHFLDPVNEVFYQARGTTAFDWHLVAPADLVGSFVKVFDQFLGLPQDDPQGDSVRRMTIEALAVRETMQLAGIHVPQAFAWKVGEVAIAQARIRIERPASLSLFVGFATHARPIALPSGVGFRIDDGVLRFGADSNLGNDETVLLRIEIDGVIANGFVNDQHFASMSSREVETNHPVVALFDRSTGPRPIAPGYELALKRMLAWEEN